MKLLLEGSCALPSRVGLLLGGQIGSFLLTGCLVWTATRALPVNGSLGQAAVRAAALVLLAWASNSLLLAGIYYLSEEPVRQHLCRIARASGAAIWTAPAASFLRDQSSAVFPAVLIAAVLLTRLLYADWKAMHGEREPHLADEEQSSFLHRHAAPEPSAGAQLPLSIALALSLQLGVAAALMRYPLVAITGIALGAAILTVLTTSAGWLPPYRASGRPPSIARTLLPAALAAALILGGSPGGPGRRSENLAGAKSQRPPRVVELVRRMFGWRPATNAAISKRGSQRLPTPPRNEQPGYEPAALDARVAQGEFPGVILWPEIKAIPMLVAPLPAGTGFSRQSLNPVGVPFSGEYWIYRAPNRRPPYGSFFRRASPLQLGFSTPDRAPLRMEARHRLDQDIDLGCCSVIQLDIWNADGYPGTLGLELHLLDRNLPNAAQGVLSLGAALVKSISEGRPVKESLLYQVPQPAPLKRFNEFRVVFHLGGGRRDKSAKIEIDRFVLVPAGRQAGGG